MGRRPRGGPTCGYTRSAAGAGLVTVRGRPMHPSTLPRQAVLACPKAAARPTNPGVGGAAARLRRRRRRPPTHATRSCRRRTRRADEPIDALGVGPLDDDVTRSAPARAGAAVVGAQRRTRARTLGVRGDRRHGRVDADQELGRAAPQPEHVQLTGDRRVARRAEGGVVHALIAAQRRRRHRAPRRRIVRCCRPHVLARAPPALPHVPKLATRFS